MQLWKLQCLCQLVPKVNILILGLTFFDPIVFEVPMYFHFYNFSLVIQLNQTKATRMQANISYVIMIIVEG